jgi:hypothetical protein
VEREGRGVGGDAVGGVRVGRGRRRLALPALLFGSFMGVLDPFVVTVALPAIRSDLGAPAAQAQWIVAGYGAAYGRRSSSAGASATGTGGAASRRSPPCRCWSPGSSCTSAGTAPAS